MNRYLRSLTPDQQMNWLFGLVLCMLLLASAVAWLLDWRDSHQIQPRSARPNYDYADMVRRSWWMSMIFWVCWVCGPVGATILFALVSFLTLREYISLTPTHRSDHRTLVLIFFIILPLQYALLVKQQFLLFSVLIPVYAFLAIPVFSSLGNEPKGFLERTAKLQWGVMVCIYGLSHVPALLSLKFSGFAKRQIFLVFFLVVVVQTSVVVQHTMTRIWRRQPALPAISQSFQWHSWVLGVLGGGFLGGVLAGITPFKPAQALAMALIACASGTLGHLAMKAIKRDRGVPHWGGWGASVTGASGLLDRVDALAFAAPVFFQALRWIFKV